MHIHKADCLQGPVTAHRDWWKINAAAAAADGTLFRSALVRQVRQEIAAGTYETPEKLEMALERMLGEVS